MGMDNNEVLHAGIADELAEAQARIAELELQVERDSRFLMLAKKLLELSSEAIFHIDAQYRILQGNAAFCRLFETDLDELRGRDVRELFTDGAAVFPDKAVETLQSTGRWEGEIKRSGAWGEPRIEHLVMATIPSDGQDLDSLVGIIRDLSELHSTRAILEYSTTHDALTGLPNRDFFNAALGELARRSLQNCGIAAVCLLDIDDFKAINNDLSREAGDGVLRTIAERLSTALRAGDLLARTGGDEFSLALPLKSVEELKPLATRILRVFDEPFMAGGRPLYLSATMGISLCPEHGSEASDLSACADLALQGMKLGSKRSYLVYQSDLGERLQGKASLSSELHSALEAPPDLAAPETGRITVQYQPLVEISSGLVVGTEALARWEHPGRGSIPPARFIPLAEESNLIGELGASVLRQACAQARAWLASLPRAPRVCVNVSARQLREPSFVEEVRSSVAGLPRGLVTLEITETQLLEDLDDAAQVLSGLKETGVNLSVDDFGTGYASLSYLRRLPVDTVKIDQSFVKDLVRNRQDRRIVEVVTSLAREIGARTVAEGVESRAQLEILRDVGCDCAQGFLFSPAVHADAIADLVDGGYDCSGSFIGGPAHAGGFQGRMAHVRDKAISEAHVTDPMHGGRGPKRR